MNEVEQRTKELTGAIQRSSVYTQYQILYNELKENHQLCDRVNEFRRRRFQLEMSETDHLVEQMNGLSWEFKDILEQTLVKEFLAAEQRYGKMFRKVRNEVLTVFDEAIDIFE